MLSEFETIMIKTGKLCMQYKGTIMDKFNINKQCTNNQNHAMVKISILPKRIYVS